MIKYRCIRCGKEMEIEQISLTGMCGHCGTEQALPLINKTLRNSE